MAVPARITTRSLVLSLSGLLVTGLAVPRAWAGFVPLDNQSVCYIHTNAGSIVAELTDQAAADFFWDGQAVAEADDHPNGFANANMFMSTFAIGDTCFSAAGEGGGFAVGSGEHSGYAIGKLLFLVNQTQQYTADLGFNLHDLPGPSHYVELQDLHGAKFWRYETGNLSILGRIAPGSYWLVVKTDYFQTGQSGQAPSVGATLCFQPCVSVIGQQPADQTVTPGATVELELTFLPPPAPMNEVQTIPTYQWRKNLQNLVNGGRISGVTTAHLSIANAAVADSGLYDCVVTYGAIVEPSREAQVTVRSTTAVEPSLAASDLRLGAPKPNPFFVGTRMEFELARAGRVSLVVYDALGRRVKDLMPATSIPAGRYAVDWNGTDSAGNRVAGGVYFVHLLANGTRRLQRAVLMPGGR